MIIKYLIILVLVTFICSFRSYGQNTSWDYTRSGQTRHYYVVPNNGSVYVWSIDGIVQEMSAGNEFIHTWDSTKTYLLTVQEISLYGCPGPVRYCQVNVYSLFDYDLIIPNAFSPNGDLINDVWNIGNSDHYPEMVVTIYNRWGQMVWRSGRGYPVPWDGKCDGSDLPVDSYHYIIDFHDGRMSVIGSITVVR